MEVERSYDAQADAVKDTHTVSFHNFRSQNFKLSVLNPKSKHVAYLSVLSQISDCQSLGRKNKHEMLITDRMYIMIVIHRYKSNYQTYRNISSQQSYRC